MGQVAGFKKSSEFAKIGQIFLDCNFFWNFQKYALEVFSEQDKLISVTLMANETFATVVPEAMAAEAVAVVGNPIAIQESSFGLSRPIS